MIYCENNNANPNLYPVLGILYLHGRYVPKNIDKAILYLKKTVEAQIEIDYIHYELANLYYEKNHMIATYFLGKII